MSIYESLSYLAAPLPPLSYIAAPLPPLSYIAAAGVLKPDEDGFFKVDEDHRPAESAGKIMAFAKDMLRSSKMVCHRRTVVSSVDE